MEPIDRNKPCTVTLSAEEWQNTLAVLRKAPYEVVAGIIEQIIVQCLRTNEHSPADAG